jgi:glycosyltransferase involved in cell wall biosynthesis
MAVLAIVTSSPRGVEGGHLAIARALVAAAADSGHDAHLVVTPDYGFGRQSASYRAAWRTDVQQLDGKPVDQVISFRHPSYAVRHPAHVCWLNHTMREYYDLWPRFAASLSTKNLIKETIRKALTHGADRWLLKRHVSRVIAQSHTIRTRLAHDFAIDAGVLWPPPPPRPYRCDQYGDYIFAASRLTPLKRIDLLLRALAEPAALGVRAVVAGKGEERVPLEQLAMQLHIASRVTFIGHAFDDTFTDHLARCRAVCFPPFAEDYGLVTAEAFASRKAVITCSDSGGPTELVRDNETGIVCEPTPAALAAALARVSEDAALAERLGTAAARQVAAMTWPDAVKRLVIV